MGIISANPQFVDAANGDLHLSDDSPGICAGSSDISGYSVTTDKDSKQCVVNGSYDLGAYRCQGN